MAATTGPRLTAGQARRVGFELGGLLVCAGAAMMFRRGVSAIATMVAAVGVVLFVLTLARSSVLVPIARVWLALALALSRIMTPVVLTVIYLTVFTPMAWMRRLIGRSPLDRATTAETYWVRREIRRAEELRRSMERQF